MGALSQLRLDFHKCTQRPVHAFTCKDFPVPLLALVAFLIRGGKVYDPLTHVSFLTLKTEPLKSHCQGLATNTGWDLVLLNLICIRFPLLILFRSRKFLRLFFFLQVWSLVGWHLALRATPFWIRHGAGTVILLDHRRKGGNDWDLLKPSDRPSLMRPHLIIPPQQLHQLGTKYLNV